MPYFVTNDFLDINVGVITVLNETYQMRLAYKKNIWVFMILTLSTN